jgi:hypothetical protein
MISFHSSACSLYVFTVVLQNIVELFVLFRNSFPIKENACPIKYCRYGEHFGKRSNPSVGFPSNITEGVFNQPEEIFEASSFVSFVDAFLSQSEFLEFPIVLFSH